MRVIKTKTSNDLLPNKNCESPARPEERSFLFRKVLVSPLKISKDSRSFSPQLRANLGQEDLENAKLLRKYRRMRVEEQEREIQRSHVLKQIEEETRRAGDSPSPTVAGLLVKLVAISLGFIFD